jgi:hypothetical protein
MSMQSPSPSFEPTPGVGASTELKRSVSEATERISEIITAAEQVALDIRTDAETQARNYVAAQQREIDRVVNERSGALDRMTETLVESAERFRRQAEQMLNSLEVVIDEARQALDSDRSAIARPADIPELELAPTPVAQPAFRPEPGFTPMPARAADPEPEPEPEAEAEAEIEEIDELEEEVAEIEAEAEAEVEAEDEAEAEAEAETSDEPAVRLAAYQGTAVDEDEAPSSDDSAEAMLRATQMAIAGNTREEIARVLEADFPGVDSNQVLNEILGS